MYVTHGPLKSPSKDTIEVSLHPLCTGVNVRDIYNACKLTLVIRLNYM